MLVKFLKVPMVVVKNRNTNALQLFSLKVGCANPFRKCQVLDLNWPKLTYKLDLKVKPKITQSFWWNFKRFQWFYLKIVNTNVLQLVWEIKVQILMHKPLFDLAVFKLK